MQTPLNTKYRTLTVYFNMYASMALQFKADSPKFTNKLLPPAILPYPKVRHRETRRAIHSSIPQLSPESLIMYPGWKVIFEKRGELMPSKKANTQFWNYFNKIKILAWLVSQKHNFWKNDFILI